MENPAGLVGREARSEDGDDVRLRWTINEVMAECGVRVVYRPVIERAGLDGSLARSPWRSESSRARGRGSLDVARWLDDYIWLLYSSRN